MAAALRTHPSSAPNPHLVALMVRLATGDGVALYELWRDFAGPLRGAVLRGLRRLHVVPEPDLVEELVMEVALVVQTVAPGWSPEGGALPWVWAEPRINARIS